MKLMGFIKYGRIKPLLLSTSSMLMLIFSVIAIYVFQPSYAEVARTTEVKVQLNKLIEQGDRQIIRVSVRDQATGLPVSGATVRLIITYPGGTTVRQFNLITDANGLASLTLPISNNAPTGVYALDALVTAIGYFDSPFNTISFTVMSHVKATNSQDYSRVQSHGSVHNHHLKW
ncbi:MAG: hypothetical protein JO297_10960 [Nitrososphaeraceae archaeon]|nr:hypothetical protein [Nitrososphaeraceae archaeon]